MRRLPVFLVLDVSESMVGEPLRQLEAGVERIIRTLRQDPHALESVYVSVIAFAGKAEVIAPLIDLVSFYPPRMPIGGGTALGAALNLLMEEIDSRVTRTTMETRGDWEPVCYLITDGRPTDNPAPAVERWREKFASRAQLIAITLGRSADMQVLRKLTASVLALEQSGDEDFKRFIDWVTASVQAQSLAVDAGGGQGGVSLEKAQSSGLAVVDDKDAASAVSDPQAVVLTGRCQRTRKPYLMKYAKPEPVAGMERFVSSQYFGLEGCFALEESYFDWTVGKSGDQVHTSALEGAPTCPHCGNATAFAMCSCGGLTCLDGPGVATCPWCEKQLKFGSGGSDDFSVARGQG